MSLQRQVLLVDQNRKAHQWHKEQPTIQCVQIQLMGNNNNYVYTAESGPYYYASGTM